MKYSLKHAIIINERLKQVSLTGKSAIHAGINISKLKVAVELFDIIKMGLLLKLNSGKNEFKNEDPKLSVFLNKIEEASSLEIEILGVRTISINDLNEKAENNPEAIADLLDLGILKE